MKLRSGKIAKWTAGAVVFFIVAAYIAGRQRADRYSGRIRDGLEAALGRKVEIGEVRFNLLTGPGFSIGRVIIHEDPAIGQEPFIYVDSLQARVSLLPLLTGRLEFASLRLEDASVNLMKTDTEPASGPAGANTARWNFTPMLRPAVFASLPEVHVRSSRINFKFGETKSVFYFTGSEVDLSPPARTGRDWEVRFSGAPARTDRAAGVFGSLLARGRWRHTRDGGTLDMNFELERSAIGEIITLVSGRDSGIHGTVSARARVLGAIDNLQINGRLDVRDVHRWDLAPPKGDNWPFDFSGRWDAPGQKLELESHSAAKEAPPLSVRFRVSDYLATPHWGISANWNRFRVEPLLELARHMGAPLSPALQMTGTLDGAIGYAGRGSLQGQLAFKSGAVTIPDSPPIRFEQANLLFDSGRMHLAPAVVRTAGNDAAQLEADYRFDAQAVQLSIASDSMDVAGLRSQAALPAIPMLEQVKGGKWKGRLQYEGGGGWSGGIDVSETEIALPGLADICKLDSASAQIDGAQLILRRMEGSVGDIRLHGDYRYEPASPRPHRFHLSIPSIPAAELERLLMPTLKRNSGLIARALHLGRAPVPDWLRDRHMDGSIQIGVVDAPGVDISKLRARVLWDGTRVEVADIEARVNNGTLDGRLSVNLRGSRPVYRLSSRLKSVEWNGGRLNAEALSVTNGLGGEIVTNLHSDGSFSGHSFDVSPLNQFKTISGCYVLDRTQRIARWRFTDLQLSTGAERYLGRGATQDDGKLLVQVSNGSKRLNVTGTLAQLRFDEQ